jgi:hypothetical protein
VNVFAWGKDIAHDNKVDFSSTMGFYPVETIEARYQRIGVVTDMLLKGENNGL